MIRHFNQSHKDNEDFIKINNYTNNKYLILSSTKNLNKKDQSNKIQNIYIKNMKKAIHEENKKYSLNIKQFGNPGRRENVNKYEKNKRSMNKTINILQTSSNLATLEEKKT